MLFPSFWLRGICSSTFCFKIRHRCFKCHLPFYLWHSRSHIISLPPPPCFAVDSVQPALQSPGQVHTKHPGLHLIQTNLFWFRLTKWCAASTHQTSFHLLWQKFNLADLCHFCEQWFPSWAPSVEVDSIRCPFSLVSHWDTNDHRVKCAKSKALTHLIFSCKVV